MNTCKSIPTDRLSSLLAAAAEDCIKYDELVKDESARFYWDMGTWLSVDDPPFTGNFECIACMAGAVLWMRTPKNEIARQSGRAGEIPWQIAIDYMRQGRFVLAYHHTYKHHPTGQVKRFVLQIENEFRWMYNRNDGGSPSRYLSWDQYLLLADKLAEAGL